MHFLRVQGGMSVWVHRFFFGFYAAYAFGCVVYLRVFSVPVVVVKMSVVLSN